MKKVLFATTALVASAGIASAEVAISGSAEMGIAGGSGMETSFFQSVDVRFKMTGETDNGLTFGATIDLDDLADMTLNGYDPIDQGGTNQFSDYNVFLSGSFGTITMGDTDGAFDWALSEVAVGSSIADDHTAHAGYNGNSGMDGSYGGQVARYDYSFGDFAFAVSANIDDTGVGDPALGIGGRYSGDLGGVNLAVGLGYQTNNVNDIIGVSVRAKMDNGVEAILNYSDLDGFGGNESHMGIGLGYSMDALTIGVNYGVYDRTVGADNEGYGLAVNYDLGGGAVVQFGYGNGHVGAAADVNTFSLGVAMSF